MLFKPETNSNIFKTFLNQSKRSNPQNCYHCSRFILQVCDKLLHIFIKINIMYEDQKWVLCGEFHWTCLEKLLFLQKDIKCGGLLVTKWRGLRAVTHCCGWHATPSDYVLYSVDNLYLKSFIVCLCVYVNIIFYQILQQLTPSIAISLKYKQPK